MAVSDGLRRIMGVFGTMLGAAVEAGRGPANMWNAFREGYAAIGQERPPATLNDMNRFVVGLGGIMRSLNALRSAGDGDAFTSTHWAYPIGYEPSAADMAAPTMLATFEAHIATEEGLVSRWSTVGFNQFFPATVGELRDIAASRVQEQLDMSAMEEGEPSPTAGGQVESLGDMYVTARGLAVT